MQINESETLFLFDKFLKTKGIKALEIESSNKVIIVANMKAIPNDAVASRPNLYEIKKLIEADESQIPSLCNDTG